MNIYSALKDFIWPNYLETKAPKQVDFMLLRGDLLDDEGELKEPFRSVIHLTVLGHQPVTILSILAAFVGGRNAPLHGAQIGRELEERFQVPKGWFTESRYYDTRIGKILKMLCRLRILERLEVRDTLSKRKFEGYRINLKLYPVIETSILGFFQGRTFSPFLPQHADVQEKELVPKQCSKCNSISYSPKARFCELCGSGLMFVCPHCGKEVDLDFTYCLFCGKKILETSMI
jgi:hypothetical protein